MSEAIFNLEILFNTKISPEYKDLSKDLYKFIIVFLSVTILFSYSESPLAKLVEQSALEVLVFVVIGLCAYHLVIKKFVTLS